uniref:Homeobox domain-containing protein n=1 Tax=Parastrongyloides trichosuri TaxID=131310 RepID=A0A0N4ZBX8_PARTI
MLNSFKSSLTDPNQGFQPSNSSFGTTVAPSPNITEDDITKSSKLFYPKLDSYFSTNINDGKQNKWGLKEELGDESYFYENGHPFLTFCSGILQGNTLNFNYMNGLMHESSQENNSSFKNSTNETISDLYNESCNTEKNLYLPNYTDHCFKNMFSHSSDSDRQSLNFNNTFGSGNFFINQLSADHNNIQFDTNNYFAMSDLMKNDGIDRLDTNKDGNYDVLSLTDELNMIRSTSQENLNQLASEYGTERMDITSELKNKLRMNKSSSPTRDAFAIFNDNAGDHDNIATTVNNIIDDDKSCDYEWDEGVEDPNDAEVEEILENYANQNDCNMDGETLTKYDERIEINEDTNVAVLDNIGPVFIKSGTSNVKFKTTKLKEICDNVLRQKIADKHEDEKVDNSVNNVGSIVDDWVEISESLNQNLAQPMEHDDLPEPSVLSDIEMLLDEPVMKKPAICHSNDSNKKKCLLVNYQTWITYISLLIPSEVGILDTISLNKDYYMLIFNKENEASRMGHIAQIKGLYAETYESIRNSSYDQCKKRYWTHPDVLKWL